jgi:hypothetical protein
MRSSVQFQGQTYIYEYQGIQVTHIEDTTGGEVTNPLIRTVASLDVKLYHKDSYLDPETTSYAV